jgi:hypothetical protein
MISINTIIIIIFYATIFFLVYKHRKKFDIEKIGSIPLVFLRRTKFGIKFIDKIGKKHSKFLKILGYIGMVIGFIGMIAMFALIAESFIKTFLFPNQPTGVSPVIPGVKIPGAQIYVPFWYGIIALFAVVVFHEFGHGVIAKAHKFKINATGFGLFAVLPVAFVEPDEKHIVKAKPRIQNSVYAAGPWFNAILSIVALLLLFFVMTPLNNAVADYQGFEFTHTDNNSPAQLANLPVNTTFNMIDNVTISTVTDLSTELADVKPGDKITLTDVNKNSYDIVLGNHPEDNNSAYIGVMNLSNTIGNTGLIDKILLKIIEIISGLLFWIYLLSLGIGSANLLPIGPLDGGRMFYTFMLTKFSEARAKLITRKISLITIFFLVVSLIVPIIRAIF